MEFHKLRIIPLVILLVSVFLICSSSAQPQLEFQLAPSLELAQIVYVSDFDFYRQGATQFLFQLTLDNTSRPQAIGYLRFEIFRDDDPIAETRSNDFILMADERFTVSNIELNAGFFTPMGNQPIRFDETNTTNPSSEFEDEVLTSGKLPRGTYRFIVSFHFNNDQDQLSAPPVAIYVNNPSFIRPITPGTIAGDPYLEVLYTQFPTFQFETDLDLNNPFFFDQPPFHVQIFKQLDQHASVDEVLTTQPHYDAWISDVVFPYPAYAAQPLDPGVYFWRIQLEFLTTSGQEVIESPVYAFRVEDPSTLGQINDEGMKSEVMQILENLLGNEGRQYIEQLGDYDLIDIRVNGESITLKRLYEIIENYQGEERHINDIFLNSTQ